MNNIIKFFFRTLRTKKSVSSSFLIFLFFLMFKDLTLAQPYNFGQNATFLPTVNYDQNFFNFNSFHNNFDELMKIAKSNDIDFNDLEGNFGGDEFFEPSSVVIAQINDREKKLVLKFLNKFIDNAPEIKSLGLSSVYGFEKVKSTIVDKNLAKFVETLKVDLINLPSASEFKNQGETVLRYLDLLELARTDDLSNFLNDKKLILKIEDLINNLVEEPDLHNVFPQTFNLFFSLLSAKNLNKSVWNDTMSLAQMKSACQTFLNTRKKFEEYIKEKGIFRNLAYLVLTRLLNQWFKGDYENFYNNDIASYYKGATLTLRSAMTIFDSIEGFADFLNNLDENDNYMLNLPDGRFLRVLQNLFLSYHYFMECFNSIVTTLITPFKKIRPDSILNDVKYEELKKFLEKMFNSGNFNVASLLEAYVYFYCFVVDPRKFLEFGKGLDQTIEQTFKEMLTKNIAMAPFEKVGLKSIANFGSAPGADVNAGYDGSNMLYFKDLTKGGELRYSSNFTISKGENPLDYANVIHDNPETFARVVAGNQIVDPELESAIYKIAQALKTSSKNVNIADNNEFAIVRTELGNTFDEFVAMLEAIAEGAENPLVGGESESGCEIYDPGFIAALKNSKEFIVSLALVPDYFHAAGEASFVNCYTPMFKEIAKIVDGYISPVSDVNGISVLFYKNIETSEHHGVDVNYDLFCLRKNAGDPGNVLPVGNNEVDLKFKGVTQLAGEGTLETWLKNEQNLKTANGFDNKATFRQVIEGFMEAIQFLRDKFNVACKDVFVNCKTDKTIYDSDGADQGSVVKFNLNEIINDYFFNTKARQNDQLDAVKNMYDESSDFFDQLSGAADTREVNTPEWLDFFDELNITANYFEKGRFKKISGKEFFSDFIQSPFLAYNYGVGCNSSGFLCFDETKATFGDANKSFTEWVAKEAEKENLPNPFSREDLDKLIFFQLMDFLAEESELKGKNGVVKNRDDLKRVFEDDKNENITAYCIYTPLGEEDAKLASTEISVIDFYRGDCKSPFDPTQFVGVNYNWNFVYCLNFLVEDILGENSIIRKRLEKKLNKREDGLNGLARQAVYNKQKKEQLELKRMEAIKKSKQSYKRKLEVLRKLLVENRRLAFESKQSKICINTKEQWLQNRIENLKRRFDLAKKDLSDYFDSKDNEPYDDLDKIFDDKADGLDELFGESASEEVYQ